MDQPDGIPGVVDVLYHEFFVNHQMLNKPEVVVALFAKALNISQEDAQALYGKGSSPEAKALLKQNTKWGFEQGAFGLPWIIGSAGGFLILIEEIG
jgi:2-hydroxychromene-2-carboxylate isomerase